MLRREVRLYARSRIFELWDIVSLQPIGTVKEETAPLLGRKKDIVVGTVTRAVTVRMK